MGFTLYMFVSYGPRGQKPGTLKMVPKVIAAEWRILLPW